MIHCQAPPVLAIDLGTAFIYSALCSSPTSARVLPHGDGQHNSYSYVAFYEQQILTGIPAKGLSSKSSPNVVYDFKNLIGRTSSEHQFMDRVKSLPFTLKTSEEGHHIVQIAPTFKKNRYPLEELLAVLFELMKQSAEKVLQGPIVKTVLTVPCNYNSRQRHAISHVAESVGLETVRLLSQSTASLLHFKTTHKQAVGNVLLVKLGAGSLEVLVAAIEGETLTVLSSTNTSCLNGDAFDQLMVDQCVRQFREQHKIDVSGNVRACKRLKNQCEKARMALSSQYTACVEIDSLAHGEDFVAKFTRNLFEAMAEGMIQDTANFITQGIKKAGIETDKLNHTVLVGGASPMPWLSNVLIGIAPHIQPMVMPIPSQTAVQGAALYGYCLLNPSASDILLMNVTTNCLWIRIDRGIPSLLVDQGQFLPLTKTLTITPTKHFVNIDIFQGAKQAPAEACRVGSHRFQIDGEIQLKLIVDLNKIYKLEARDQQSMKLLANLDSSIEHEQPKSAPLAAHTIVSHLDDID